MRNFDCICRCKSNNYAFAATTLLYGKNFHLFDLIVKNIALALNDHCLMHDMLWYYHQHDSFPVFVLGTECNLLYLYWSMKALMEVHFVWSVVHIKSLLLSMLSNLMKTAILLKLHFYTIKYNWNNYHLF